MLIKLKKRIDNYLNKKLKRFYIKQRFNSEIQFSQTQLNQLFSDTSFFWPCTDWSISPSTILHVLNDIVINERKVIVEFGSGTSTFYIAKLLKTHNIEASFYSIESSSEWSNKLTRQLEILDLTSFVTIINSSIQPIDKSLALGKQNTWYDVNVLNKYFKSITDIDLVLVDGPFGGETSYARYSAVPFLKNKLAKDFGVFLDDVHRRDEIEILKAWKTILNCNLQRFKRYAILSTSNNLGSLPYRF